MDLHVIDCAHSQLCIHTVSIPWDCGTRLGAKFNMYVHKYRMLERSLVAALSLCVTDHKRVRRDGCTRTHFAFLQVFLVLLHLLQADLSFLVKRGLLSLQPGPFLLQLPALLHHSKGPGRRTQADKHRHTYIHTLALVLPLPAPSDSYLPRVTVRTTHIYVAISSYYT